ncbi:MAG: hypothetical protein ACSHXI_22435 [Hoeflea sp.]|uniref:hypothetical protein n=1 Tax=Hoeflea sp. TaxID=1940281 RepID=UPI003EF1DB83
MLYTGHAAVARAQEILDAARPWFSSTNVHLIANLETAVRQTDRDQRALIAGRAETEAQVNIALLRLRELGMSVSLYHSDAEFLAGISTGNVDWTKPIQLAYSGTKYSAIDGIRCLTPIICALRSITCTNSGVMGRALGWNKFLSTRILEASGIPTPQSWHFKKHLGWKGNEAPADGQDLIIKNNTEAWGLGVSADPIIRGSILAEVETEIERILKATGLTELIVQEFVYGPEIYAPVFRLWGDFFVFDPVEIYIQDNDWSQGNAIGIDLNRRQKHAFRRMPDKELAKEISRFAARAMEELEIDILSRMDFRVDQTGTPKLFDMAEVPGLSEDHAIGQSLKSCGAPFDSWELMMALNIQRFRECGLNLAASAQGD